MAEVEITNAESNRNMYQTAFKITYRIVQVEPENLSGIASDEQMVFAVIHCDGKEGTVEHYGQKKLAASQIEYLKG